MLRKLIKNKKAQNTAEYAILISLVVAGIIAMQTFAQRALQAKVKDGVSYLNEETSDLGSTVQYEPYYIDTNYEIESDSTQTRNLGTNLDGRSEDSSRTRKAGGGSNVSFNGTGW